MNLYGKVYTREHEFKNGQIDETCYWIFSNMLMSHSKYININKNGASAIIVRNIFVFAFLHPY